MACAGWSCLLTVPAAAPLRLAGEQGSAAANTRSNSRPPIVSHTYSAGTGSCGAKVALRTVAICRAKSGYPVLGSRTSTNLGDARRPRRSPKGPSSNAYSVSPSGSYVHRVRAFFNDARIFSASSGWS